MNEFAERYKTFSTIKLLHIIEEADKYQPEAIKAAYNELESREVEEEERRIVKQKIDEDRARDQKRVEKRQEIEKRTKAVGTEFIKTISPIQDEPQTTFRRVNLIVIIFLFFSIYDFINSYSLIQFMLNDISGGWDLPTILELSSVVLLPITVYLLWRRNKVGWIFAVVHLSYVVTALVSLLFSSIRYKQMLDEVRQDPISDGITLDFNPIETIFPVVEPSTCVIGILMFLAVGWLVVRKDIREVFAITKNDIFITIGLAFLVVAALLF